MKTKVLEQMEARAAATPKGAVLLWLAQHVTDRTAAEGLHGLLAGIDGDRPRTQIKKQLEEAIRTEMRGEGAGAHRCRGAAGEDAGGFPVFAGFGYRKFCPGRVPDTSAGSCSHARAAAEHGGRKRGRFH